MQKLEPLWKRPVRAQVVQADHIFLGISSAEELIAKIIKRHPDPQFNPNDNSVERALTS